MIDLTKVYKEIWRNLSNLSSCQILDYIPYGYKNFPYAYIGGLYTNDDSTKNAEGLSCELYINIYSAYKGRKEILEIINEINKLMNKDINTEEYSIFIYKGRHTVIQDKDNIGFGTTDNNTYFHAVLIYEVKVYENK